MDEKEMNHLPEDEGIGQTGGVPQAEDQPNAAPEEKQETAASEEPSPEWKFDGQVETDLSNLNISYSGKEIEIVAPLMKELPQNDDTITISKTKMKKTFKIFGVVIAALAGVAIVALGVVYGFFLPNHLEVMTPANTALKVEHSKISVGAYNYYYNSFTSDSYLKQYVNYGLDTSLPYDKQYYDEAEGVTWADYFENTAVEELKYVSYYYNCAKKAGMKLTDEEKEQLKTSLESLDATASSAGKSTQEYLKETYGDYVGVKTIRKMQEQRYLANLYVQQLSATEKISAEDVTAYRQENPAELEVASFRYLPIPYTADTKEEMLAKGEELKSKLTTPETFTEIAKPYAQEEYQDYITDSYTLITAVTSTNEQIPGNIREWLFTDGVQVGNVNILEDEEQSCFYVVMMSETPHLNEEKLFSVRHLLVKVESSTGEDGNAQSPTEEQWNACKEKAQGFLDEFNKTDKSELAFAKLADEKSEDTASTSAAGSNNYGGLLAQSKVGAMVEPFENWCVDAARQYGDVGLVQTEYGYHLIFFISNQEAWKYTAENAMLGEKQETAIEKITADKKLGFKKRAVATVKTENNESSTAV